MWKPGQRISARVNSQCQGPEVGTYLDCSVNDKEVSVAGGMGGGSRRQGQRTIRGQTCEGL